MRRSIARSLGVLARRVECRNRCGWFVLGRRVGNSAAIRPAKSVRLPRFGFTTRGFPPAMQTKAFDLGGKTLRRTPHEVFASVAAFGNKGRRYFEESVAQRWKAPRVTNGTTFHAVVSRRAFGASERARPPSIGAGLVRVGGATGVSEAWSE